MPYFSVGRFSCFQRDAEGRLESWPHTERKVGRCNCVRRNSEKRTARRIEESKPVVKDIFRLFVLFFLPSSCSLFSSRISKYCQLCYFLICVLSPLLSLSLSPSLPLLPCLLYAVCWFSPFFFPSSTSSDAPLPFVSRSHSSALKRISIFAPSKEDSL